MFDLQGKYGKATIMLDSLGPNTTSQIYKFLNHKTFTNKIVIMPDTHSGAGTVIGFTMPMHSKMIIPNIVGVDINCGMLMLIMNYDTFPEYLTKDHRMLIDQKIRQAIPFGTNIHNTPAVPEKYFWSKTSADYREFILKFNRKYGTSHTPINFDYRWFEEKCYQINMDTQRAAQSIGTLGGGNHFIELGKSINTNRYAFTIHSGSRQFGYKICKYWQKKAGKEDLAYLKGDDMFDYLSDTIFAQCYASINRQYMANNLLSALGFTWNNVKEVVKSNHNFIDYDDFIIRKGAIRSYEGERMVIPFNMQDGILLCEGKSNPDWNFSAPHGAGRLGSRRWAKENLDINSARKNMEQNDIYCSKLPHDEIKGAYKDPELIEKAIEPTAKIIDRFRPVIAMKD